MGLTAHTDCGGLLRARPLPPGTDRAGQHAAAHALLEEALGQASPVLLRLPGGKPVLRDFPELHFSLAHCPGLAACLVAPVPCGVDVEAVRPLRERALRRAFTPEEQRQVRGSPIPDETFFRLWTLKESFVKATGEGLSYGLRRVPVSLAPGPAPRSLSPGWVFWQDLLPGGFVAAACFQTG